MPQLAAAGNTAAALDLGLLLLDGQGLGLVSLDNTKALAAFETAVRLL